MTSEGWRKIAERNAADARAAAASAAEYAAAGVPYDELFFPSLPPRPSTTRPSTAAGELGVYERQPTTSPAMIRKLIGSNNLARHSMVKLARAPGSTTERQRQMAKQMADLIENRVDRQKVQEARLPPITIEELWAYAEGTVVTPAQPRPRWPHYMPPEFPTVVEPLPPFTEASCSTRVKQLQQQLDELQKLLKEKIAMLFNLKRINYASIHHEMWLQAYSRDRRFGEECYQGCHAENWVDHLNAAQHKSEQAMLVLRDQQLPELRERIDRLTEEISRRKRGEKCNMLGGGKTKSKHTKSKHTKSNKSKIRNRKYSKRK